MYLLDRDSLGHYSTAARQSDCAGIAERVGTPWNYPVPAYFNNTIYYQGNAACLQAFQISNGDCEHHPVLHFMRYLRRARRRPSRFGQRNQQRHRLGVGNRRLGQQRHRILHAYNATNLARNFTTAACFRQRPRGAAIKWTVPMIANGKVYVGAEYALSVYGYGSFLATPTISPMARAFTNSVTVTLSDASPGVKIYYTWTAPSPTTNSTLYTGPFPVTNSTVDLQAVAVKAGRSQQRCCHCVVYQYGGFGRRHRTAGSNIGPTQPARLSPTLTLPLCLP